MTDLHLDYETYSDVDLKVHGLDRYSASPSTEVLMAAYRIGNGPLRQWDATSDGTKPPAELADALTDPHVKKWAFNAQFERVITRRVLGLKTGHKAWRCSMVAAYMLSFTGGLADIAKQLGLPSDKSKMAGGQKLIRLFCTPQKPTANQPLRRLTRHERPKDWQDFLLYNREDVTSEEHLLRKVLPMLRDPRYAWEWDLYGLDQIINDKGLPVSTQFARNALEMAERRQTKIVSEMKKLTGLKNPNSAAQLVPWLRERGYPFSDLQKDTVTKVISGADTWEYDIKEDAYTALKLRQWAARTSTRKHKALVLAADEDKQVLRFLYQFVGAGRTGRWAGRRVQTQNLPRTPKNIEDDERLMLVSGYIESGDYDALELFVKEPMSALVGTIRSAFKAPDGYYFVVSDLASIETCVIGWLAGCKRLLQVFRDGRDAYKDFATELYSVPYDLVTKAQRTDSKPAVLGAGYRLGGGDMKEGKKTGLWGYAENMGIPLTQAQSKLAVQKYRETYPEIPQLWFAFEDAVAACMATGQEQRVKYVRFQRTGEYLKMILPSGRSIFYHRPMMQQKTWEDGSQRAKLSFTYMGQHQKTGQWIRMENHGGRFTEQSVQGMARDVLAEGIKAAHKEGFDIRGHVHDEIKTIQRIGSNEHNAARLVEIMTRPIAWAPGLPLGAAAWEGPLYRKD